MSTTQFTDMIGKVRALIAKAEDPAATPEEAAAYRQKADALVFKYKIDLATAPEKERSVSGMKPEWREIPLCKVGNEWYRYYSGIGLAIIRHVDARCVTLRKNGEYVLRVVGFGVDLDYAEMLIATALLAFGKKMEPSVNPDESEAENAFRLRMGGMERHRIALALWGPQKSQPDPTLSQWTNEYYEQKKAQENEFKARNRKVTKLIEQGAKLAGEDPKTILGRGNSIKTFRESYAGGFYYMLESRLRDLALSRGETDKGLVLASLEQQIEDMFYGEYPHLQPDTTGRADYIPPNENCDKCAKTKSGYCRDHQYLKPSTAKAKHIPFNYGAFNKGEDAARTVDLGPGGTAKAGAAPTRGELG